MPDPKIERLAAQLLEAISDPKLCGHGADALRGMIKRELRKHAPNDNAQTQQVIDHGARQVAGQVENICRGLPANVRAAGVVVAAAGAVYGVSQMPEEEIRAAIAKMRADVIDRDLTIAGQRVNLSISTDLAPLFGERADVRAEARWRQQIFGQTGDARLYARDIGNGGGNYGASWSAPLDNGHMEFGANSQNGGTVYFRMQLRF